MNHQLPIARAQSLVIQELPNELLIYDLETNKTVCLNASAAFIWKHCDGKTNSRQLIDTLEREMNLTVNEEFIALALDGLAKAELIECYTPLLDDQVSRRKALLNFALPMVMLPVITNIVAPQAADAQSVVCTDPAATGSCTTAADCPPYGGCQSGCQCGVICFNNCCFNEVSCS